MATIRCWRGVRLQVFEVGSDPDEPLHRVAVPAGWSEQAARGFVGLACGNEAACWSPLRLPDAAACWIDRIAAGTDARETAHTPADWANTLHRLLLLRQGSPDRTIWRGESGPAGFVLNLAAFADPEIGYDMGALTDAVRVAARVLSVAAAEKGGQLRIADLDGALARLGLAYGDERGREAAVSILRACREALGQAPVHLVAEPAGPAEAMLGVETAGFAPPFSLLGPDGTLTEASRARLVACGLSTERALAFLLDGRQPLDLPDASAHAAMHDALASFLDETPPRPAVSPRLVAQTSHTAKRAMPARSKGFTQKVTIGGHRVYLRTAEFEDGSLGEVSITLPGREGTAARGLSDALSVAISIGLQHGVPLHQYVEAFAHSRFSPAGAVEGDPSIAWASSPADYAVRALAEAYSGRHLADPPVAAEDEPPTLPLGLEVAPHAAGGTRQRALRLVAPA